MKAAIPQRQGHLRRTHEPATQHRCILAALRPTPPATPSPRSPDSLPPLAGHVSLPAHRRARIDDHGRRDVHRHVPRRRDQTRPELRDRAVAAGLRPHRPRRPTPRTLSRPASPPPEPRAHGGSPARFVRAAVRRTGGGGGVVVGGRLGRRTRSPTLVLIRYESRISCGAGINRGAATAVRIPRGGEAGVARSGYTRSRGVERMREEDRSDCEAGPSDVAMPGRPRAQTHSERPTTLRRTRDSMEGGGRAGGRRRVPDAGACSGRSGCSPAEQARSQASVAPGGGYRVANGRNPSAKK